MGRLQALATVLAALAVACDRGGPSAGAAASSAGGTSSRSDQVLAAAQSNAPTSAPAGDPAPHAGTPAPSHARKLCQGDDTARGRSLPKTPTSHLEAAGAPRISGDLAASRGQWTWINFFAAWCGPCKEEIPRLVDWRDRLAKAGTPIHLVFLSLDDDQRELQTFLDAQPEGGVRSALWLPEGSTRARWLKSLRIKSDPELPEQALVDPEGRVRCFIEGAVEDGDYSEIAALVSQG
jgi:thiol-disulfide isomerase/thioredoxin